MYKCRTMRISIGLPGTFQELHSFNPPKLGAFFTKYRRGNGVSNWSPVSLLLSAMPKPSQVTAPSLKKEQM
jgi:hypothetical protein